MIILLVSFNSGEQKFFEDKDKILNIQDNYNSDFLLAELPQGNYEDNIDYDRLIKIFTDPRDAGAENYVKFKSFCDAIVKRLSSNDTISNIVLKDEYGNVYYNLLKDEIVGLNLEGINNMDDSGGLSFKFYIYLKEEDE